MRVTCLLAVFVCLVLAVSPVQAAEQAKLKVDVSVERPETFWNCTFITADDMVVGKPTKVVLTYSVGLSGVKEKSETLLTSGKKLAHFTLDTDKNEMVNLEVVVLDAGNSRLGSSGYQVRNNGQLEFIVVGPPATVAPQFNWGYTSPVR